MFEIGKREFLQLCKGVKSVLIILLFLVTSYYSAKFAEPLAEVTEMTAKEAAQAHVAGLMFLILIFGQLFVTSLSHDSINREIHERTMRFLVTKTTRLSILLGKFLGIWMFWFVSLFLSYLIISIITKKVSILMFSQTMSLLTFQVAFVLLLSVLIRSPGITMFVGIISSLIFPIIGGWLMLTSNPAISWLKYITPYYYMEKEDYKFLIIFVFAAVLIYLADLVFKRKEC